MNIPLKKNNWTLLTILDPDFLSGNSIKKMLSLCLKAVDFKYIRMNDLDGFAEGFRVIENMQGETLEIHQVMNVLPGVRQFNWGNFFLFNSFPSDWSCSPTSLYPFMVAQTDTTVRAIDDAYIDVITPYQEIVDTVMEHYAIHEITSGTLDDFTYPE